MSELIYGYASSGFEGGWRGSEEKKQHIIDNLLEQKTNGLFLVDPDPDDALVAFAQELRDNKLELILCFRWPAHGRNPSEEDWDYLKRARDITHRLALGNVATHEWYGGLEKSPIPGRRHAKRYLRLAKQFKFEWVCCITHRTICHDIFDSGRLKPVIQDTMCVCLCGYILMGYCYGDVRMPHQRSTSLGKGPLGARYGLNAARLKAWLSGMNCLTGAGMQTGLAGGSRAYAKKVGFTGIVAGIPFDLKGTLDKETLPPMSNPPKLCGVWEDYQNADLLTDFEKPWADSEGPEEGHHRKKEDKDAPS